MTHEGELLARIALLHRQQLKAKCRFQHALTQANKKGIDLSFVFEGKEARLFRSWGHVPTPELDLKIDVQTAVPVPDRYICKPFVDHRTLKQADRLDTDIEQLPLRQTPIPSCEVSAF